jgi:hypothetical protein
VLHPADDLLYDSGPFGPLDHQRQLHGRRAQLHGGLGIGVLRAVDDVGPWVLACGGQGKPSEGAQRLIDHSFKDP